MSLGVESIRRALSVPAEEFVKPSPVSIWISEQSRIPFRRALANLVEDIRVSAFAPFNLARGMRKEGYNGVAAALFVGGSPLSVGVGIGFLIGNFLVGVSLAGLLYMTEGYLMYKPCAANVAPYRQVLNSPTLK